jgi:putative ABC transport system permease protein
MIGNYLKIIFRNIKRQRTHAGISIAGLAIGMVCCFFILLWVINELSFDRYISNADRILRITAKWDIPESGYNTHFARCYLKYEKEIQNEITGVESVTQFYFKKNVVEYDNRSFYEDRFFYADSNFFKVFGFKMLKGTPNDALKEPYSIVLSESLVKKYFNDVDPIGKMINIIGEDDSLKQPHKITGIMSDIPMNSHFHPKLLASFSAKSEKQNWFYTYLLLRNGVSKNDIDSQLSDLIKKKLGEDAKGYSAPLQKLTDIHLYSNIDRELEPNGDIQMVYIFSIIAFLLLLIACINFINLSIANWIKRAKEIGIRKALGVSRRELFLYIFTESILFNIFAFLIAIVLIISFIPFLNSYIETNVSISSIYNWKIILIISGIVLLSGLLSGLYPSIYISSFQPVQILSMSRKRESLSYSKSFFPLVKILVIIQFSISTIVIICTFNIKSQVKYLRNKDLGFNKNSMIVLKDITKTVRDRYSSLKNELTKYPEIISVSAAMDHPSKQILDYGLFKAEGILEDPQNQKLLNVLSVDNNFISAMNIKILAGKGFSDYNEKKPDEYIINESALKYIGWNTPENAIGKRFKLNLNVPEDFQPKEGTITGIVKDFHFAHLKKKTEPMVLIMKPVFFHCILIKIRPEDRENTLLTINSEWKKIFPNIPLEYDYLDDLFSNLYKAENNMDFILSIFSIVVIVIACLGLFGVASFSIIQRTKEIGIRKVLGASTLSICEMLSRDFLILVGLANIIAWPVSYYLVNKWIINYANRIEITISPFLYAGILVLIISIFTISSLVLKASHSNPVNSIKSE